MEKFPEQECQRFAQTARTAKNLLCHGRRDRFHSRNIIQPAELGSSLQPNEFLVAVEKNPKLEHLLLLPGPRTLTFAKGWPLKP